MVSSAGADQFTSELEVSRGIPASKNAAIATYVTFFVVLGFMRPTPNIFPRRGFDTVNFTLQLIRS